MKTLASQKSSAVSRVAGNSTAGLKRLANLVDENIHLLSPRDQLLAFELLGAVHPDEKKREQCRRIFLQEIPIETVRTKFIEALGPKVRDLGIECATKLVHSGIVNSRNYNCVASFNAKIIAAMAL
jgi:hypothetical protein